MTTKAIPPPIAKREPRLVAFGAVEGEDRGKNPFKPVRYREDPWYWLRDDERKNKEVLDHLKLENSYAEQQTKHLEGLREELYKEHLSHLKETDDKPAYRHGDFFYYARNVKGLSYRLNCRKPVVGNERVPSSKAKEVVLLDVNEIAKGKKHCDITSLKPSPDHELLAFAADYNGDEVYDLYVKEIAGTDPPKVEVKEVVGHAVWGSREKIYYLKQDETKRPYQLYSHAIGTDSAKDELLFEEKDGKFFLSMGKSYSGKVLFVDTSSTETSEIHFIDLEKGDDKLKCIQPRQFGLRYDASHDGDGGFYFVTNIKDAVNHRLMYAPMNNCAASNWKEVIDYDPARKIDHAVVFKSHIVLEGRKDGLTQIWLLDHSPGKVDKSSLRQLKFDEELYEVGVSVNRVFDTNYLRLSYSSPTTPTRWIDRVMTKGSKEKDTLIKEQPVLNFDKSKYVCRRLFATAPDKTKVPISVVYHASVAADFGKKPQPCFLYGYGSYGICIDPGFNARILPYLDRGVIYCEAQIRGGGEMGRYWYEEQGKYLNKRNTFSDFIACAEFLVENNYTKPELLACEGRSAGGLLMGNVVNMRPDLFQVAIAGVPFVDLMNTMCDPSIPLTTHEWEEWGNPNENKFFDYMLSYSPYDNVREQPFPNILITAGLYDPRVAYWEPAKWASKLRSMKTSDDTEVVAKFDIDSGHFSASDRYKYIREKCYDQSYVLDKLGLGKKAKF